jgi:hypothetical protein
MAAPAPTHPPTAPHFKPMTLALAVFGLVLCVALTVLYTELPPAYRPWNVSAIGALALFATARLGLWQGVAFTAAALALKDFTLFQRLGWGPNPLALVYFAGYVLIGRVFLRRAASMSRPLAAAVGGGLAFFLTSNFAVWALGNYYPHSLAGLADCFAAGIPFYRNTLVGDVVFSAALFGAHAVLSRAYFPAERVGAAAAVGAGAVEESW